MTDIEPVTLLLDVDGVINCDRPGWPDKDMRGFVPAEGKDWPMRWSPQLVDCLDDLHGLGLVEIVWCTTWCPHADKLNALFGVRYQAAWTQALDAEQAWAAKRVKARAVLDAGKRLIWCDDEAIPRARDRRCLGMTGDALFLTPHPATGLTPKHIEQIVAFAAAPYALCG